MQAARERCEAPPSARKHVRNVELGGCSPLTSTWSDSNHTLAAPTATDDGW
jgi:hypothetical protein